MVFIGFSVRTREKLKLVLQNHGAPNCVHNIQMYANKFVVYAKFLEAIQIFLRQFNKLFLSFTLTLQS